MTSFNSESNSIEPTLNAYNTLYLLTGVTIALYGLVRYVESHNQLNYESRLARVIAGFLKMTMNLLHASKQNLPIVNEGAKLIALGPHRTGLEAFVVASNMEKAPPQFFATDYFNWIPGLSSFMAMFKMIPVAAKAQNSKGRSANADALDKASKVLDENGCVAIFPQGGFSLLGKEPRMLYSGAAKLALKHNLPIHVIRLDGFWCLENTFIPLIIRNNPLYRAAFSGFHPNNVRTTLCGEINFHLNVKNALWTEEQKMDEINAQLYAYYRHTQELTEQQIDEIKIEIANGAHRPIWRKKCEQYELEKKGLKNKSSESERRTCDNFNNLMMDSELKQPSADRFGIKYSQPESASKTCGRGLKTYSGSYATLFYQRGANTTPQQRETLTPSLS